MAVYLQELSLGVWGWIDAASYSHCVCVCFIYQLANPGVSVSYLSYLTMYDAATCYSGTVVLTIYLTEELDLIIHEASTIYLVEHVRRW